MHELAYNLILLIFPFLKIDSNVCFAFIAFGQAENLAYSIPGRTSVSNSVTVEDLSYDAVKDHSPLIRTGGLGMLTDGEYGISNFKEDSISPKGMLVI